MQTVNQKLDDHLQDCIRTREAIFQRLGKIDDRQIAAGRWLVGILCSVVLALLGELYRLQTVHTPPAVAVAVQPMTLPAAALPPR